jgi:hypothetical protein
VTTIIRANGSAAFTTDWDADRAYRDSFPSFNAYWDAKQAHRAAFHGPRAPVLTPVDSDIEHTVVDFGVVDSKGRKLACRIGKRTTVVALAEARSDEHHGIDVEAGTYVMWIGNAMRGGEPFGALQNWHWCSTEAERDEQIAKYVKGAKQRGLKLAAKVAA